MKLSLLIMAAISTLVLAGPEKKEESVLCKKCYIYSLEHCEKVSRHSPEPVFSTQPRNSLQQDVCKDKPKDGTKGHFEWYQCMQECDRDDTCKYVPAGETVACGNECSRGAICPTT